MSPPYPPANPLSECVCVCVCVCFLPIHSGRQICFWTYNSQGHPGFLIHLPSVVLALTSLVRRIQPSLSLVDREVEFCVLRPFLMLSKNAVEKDLFQTQLFTASIFRPAVLMLSIFGYYFGNVEGVY